VLSHMLAVSRNASLWLRFPRPLNGKGYNG
jgi:hypothetical protein